MSNILMKSSTLSPADQPSHPPVIHSLSTGAVAASAATSMTFARQQTIARKYYVTVK
ncbi:UNVERIFIED_ORG: hypothetical protein GGD59_005329 [Rhizobium esperanzae]|uniref:hypothetical protein n=1 Tax=Rhizobium phaseoli TaxID=396 RepID=UPI000ADE9109|nr:hypothetical protein [Rhizobium phaseoli]